MGRLLVGIESFQSVQGTENEMSTAGVIYKVPTWLVVMSVDHCRVSASALFKQNSEAVNLLSFLDTDQTSYGALDNGTIDVLTGGRVEWAYNFKSSTASRGFQFSTPYYYGNETSE